MERQEKTTVRKRGRLIRRLFWTAGIASVFLVVGVLGLYIMAGRTPSWYEPMTDSAVSDWADRALNKLTLWTNWAAGKHAAEVRRSQGTPDSPVVQANANEEELTISLTQEEINSFLTRWYVMYGQQKLDNGQRLSDVLRSPMVRLERDRITLAGTMELLGNRVLSLDAQPIVEGEKLQLKLLSVRSGNLPLPDFTWKKSRAMLIKVLRSLAEQQQVDAEIDQAGAANSHAVSATLARQGADTLGDLPTYNVLFLPISQQSGMAVRLKSCELQSGMITLTTEPLTIPEREQLLRVIKGK